MFRLSWVKYITFFIFVVKVKCISFSFVLQVLYMTPFSFKKLRWENFVFIQDFENFLFGKVTGDASLLELIQVGLRV